MKILVLGHLYGELDLINTYIEKSKCDFVLCTGDLGIYSRKNICESNFYEYLEGRKKFNKQVIAVWGTYDDVSLCNKIVNKEFEIDNFHLINNGEIFIHRDVKIGGLCGSYSPTVYRNENPKGIQKNHFNYKQVDRLKNSLDILLLYDLIGDCKKNQVNFSNESLDLFIKSDCAYAFVGKYQWWGSAKLPGRNIVMIPKATKGYITLDTITWDAEAIRFDLSL